jgi:hypothetical protein
MIKAFNEVEDAVLNIVQDTLPGTDIWTAYEFKLKLKAKHTGEKIILDDVSLFLTSSQEESNGDKGK